MKRFLNILVFLLLILIISGLKDKGNENSGLVLSSKQLNANNISTWFRNNGSFNYDPFNYSNPGFEWPKGTHLFARFASGLWLGARVGNDTLVAIASYRSEYLPGYTDNNGIPQGENDPLYKIYKLNLGVNDEDRLNWPNALLGNSNQGAPVFFDVSSNSWKPLDFGHQTLFYRYTDSYPESHTMEMGSTAPLKADIMKIDFSIDVPGGLADVAFSQFTVINKSNTTWNDTYFTFWTDDDLGMAVDDKIGCDSALNLGYTYNATNFDYQYGSAPPAVAFLVLRGALQYTANNNDTVYICRNKTRIPLIGYKDLKMSVFSFPGEGADPCWGEVWHYRESYRYMSGLNRCGQQIIHPSGYPTKLLFSGDPVTNQGWLIPGGEDRRFLLSTGPVNMAPNDTQVVVIAQLIARGTSNLNSITKLRELSWLVKEYYNSCYNTIPIGIQPISNEIPGEFKLYQNYPNPFNPKTIINFQLPISNYVNLKVYDIMGREIVAIVNEHLTPGIYEVEWDATNYPSGVYFYKLITGNYSVTKKMVLIK